MKVLLEPFQSCEEYAPARLQIFAGIKLLPSSLDIQFDIEGPLVLPWTSPPLSRKNELWKKICFEAFWSYADEDPRYWELNFSPAAEWNIYQFQSYRNPQPPTEDLEFSVKNIEIFEKRISAQIVGPWQKKYLKFSLCMILPWKQEIMHLASNHAGTKPDFHLRQSFTIAKGF